MSTANPSATTADAGGTSSPTPTSTQSDANTATLYLFTFLATILILILLSASLVLRSYILRRRYRRQFQRTLTDTVYVDFGGTLGGQFDPLGLRRPTRRLGPKPVLWDIWIHLDNDDAWSSYTPVAVQCATSSPPTSISPKPSTTPALAPLQSQPSFFSHFRLASPFSRSSRSRQPQPSIGSPAPPNDLSPPSSPVSPSPSANSEKEDPATMAVCILVAMPDPSAPVYCPVSDAKGKGVDPLRSQVSQSGNDVDPLLPSPLPRLSGVVLEREIPLLEFGVVEVKSDVWR